MEQPRRPRDVFLTLVNGIADGNPDGLPELYAEQTDVVHPFDPLHGPALRSREELRKRMESLAARPRERRRVGNVRIHETTDPEVIVAEFEYQGTKPGTGEAYALPAIFVMRVRDGEIVESRDYHDHLASARAGGRLGALCAALKAQDAVPARTDEPGDMSASTRAAGNVGAVCAGVSRLIAGRLDAAGREAQLDQLAALYAERTDVRHPFAIGGGVPLRTRAELRSHFAKAVSGAEGIERFETVGLRVHQTSDPEVTVTEFRYEGSSGGRPFSIPSIFVTRVRDGMIVESRDYADHIAAARAFGHLDNVIASLAAEARA